LVKAQPLSEAHMPADQARFLPFHAINQFMVDEYRQKVIQQVIETAGELPEAQRNDLNRLTRRYVQVPGFRHADKAPAHFKIRPSVDAFQRRSDFTAAVLAAWAALNLLLAGQVHSLLTGRGWELLPLDADRTKLPGFFTRWPENENYDLLQAAMKEAHPDQTASDDDISLMAVWLSTRLPFENSTTPAAPAA
jgi:hypothetical protein